MTWGLQMQDRDGNNICCYNDKCESLSECYIIKTRWNLALLLTSIATMPSGKMAGGTMVLKCNGYKKKEEVTECQKESAE